MLTFWDLKITTTTKIRKFGQSRKVTMKIGTSLDSAAGKKKKKKTKQRNKKTQNFPQGCLFFSKDLFLNIRPVYCWGD